jgi:hypothetical protein
MKLNMSATYSGGPASEFSVQAATVVSKAFCIFHVSKELLSNGTLSESVQTVRVHILTAAIIKLASLRDNSV